MKRHVSRRRAEGRSKVFFHSDIKGWDLPPRTLSLTYDDGPGESGDADSGARTAELGRYLCEEGIQATFFAIGRHAEAHAESLDVLGDSGHAIGNHTYSHPGLVALAEAGGDVMGEIERTDAIVRDLADGGPIFFRPPYGNWRQIDPATGRDRRHSIVAEQLNRSGRFGDYIGPVNWDISAEDFSFWRRGASAAEAAEAYLHQIENAGRGIVLLHDSSDERELARQNRTLELTMLLVPALKRRGYRFVPLGELPAVKRIVATRRLEARKCRSTGCTSRR